jgi:hypothetical protein
VASDSLRIDADAESATARQEPRETAAAPRVALPAAEARVLELQRAAGNRAVTSAILQRAPTVTVVRAVSSVDPAKWMSTMADQYKDALALAGSRTIVAIASNTTYVFDTEAESLRQIPISLRDEVRAPSVWGLDLAHARWKDPYGIVGPDDDPPLSAEDVERVRSALDVNEGGPGHWVLLFVKPDLAFHGGNPGTPRPSGDTPAMRRKAHHVVKDLTTFWRSRKKHQGEPLRATPTFRQRYSERTGWHLRITLGTDETEVPLREADTDEQLRARVDAAVTRLLARSDPHGPKPPPWYVPFDESPAVRDAREGANVAPLPAVVLYKPNESDTHPTVMAGAQYDFRMQVQWQFAGVLGVSEAMNAAYHWELIQVTEADWRRLTGGKRAATTAKRPEDAKIGSGKRVTKASDITASTRTEARHVGEDERNDLREGDYTGFAGESIAGTYRILSTQFISAAIDSIEHRDQSSRRVEFPAPGYYIVRCLSARKSWGSDRSTVERRMRSPSVAFIPVKAERASDVAVTAAGDDLFKAAGRGAFERYEAELTSTRSTLEAAQHLNARLAADRTLVTKLSADPVGAASQLTVPELGVLAIADGQRLSVDDVVKSLASHVKEAEGKDQENEKTVTGWHGDLKDATDYPLGATLVVSDTGQQVPLRLMVGQANGSTEQKPHWVVYDVTSERTRDRYDGRAGDHKAALRAALTTFAGENPYGYGHIGLAWPPTLGALIPDTQDLPTLLRSAPDAKKRKEHRHSAYVDIATFLLPVAKVAKALELAKAAEIFITLLGSVNAVDALKDRSRRGHLYEPSTILELAQIVGSVKLTGRAVHHVATAGELVRAARLVGNSLQLLTVLELGVQVVSIPLIVREQLKAIDSMTIGSAEHKAAMLAFVLGRAIRDGVVLVRGITHDEAAEFYNDSDERPPKRPIPPGTGTPRSGARPPLSEEEAASGRKDRARARPYDRRPPPGSPHGQGGSGRPRRAAPVPEPRNLVLGGEPRRRYTSVAELRKGLREALRWGDEDTRTAHEEQAHRKKFQLQLDAVGDRAFAERAREYFGALNDRKFLEDEMVRLWKQAGSHGRTVAQELEHALGASGNVNDFDPYNERGEDAFRRALRDPRPVVDSPFAQDFHGAYTHMFHEYLGDRLWGRGEGQAFRLELAKKKRWKLWEAMFDAQSSEGGGLNAPEILGRILQAHLDFPAWLIPTRP